MKFSKRHFVSFLLPLVCAVLAGCSPNRYIPENEYMLEKVEVKSGTAALKPSAFQGYMRQQPNSRWFSLFRAPLHLYSLSGRDSTKRFNRFLKRMGEPPVIYDRELTDASRLNVEAAVRNMGYQGAYVEVIERKRKNRVKVRYQIHPGGLYRIRNVEYDVRDTAVDGLLSGGDFSYSVKPGMPFDLNALDAERSHINTFLQNNGYFRFNEDFVRFEADTTAGNRLVDLKMVIMPYRAFSADVFRQHPTYRIGKVSYDFMQGDSLRPFVRMKRVEFATKLQEGEMYRERDVHDTYSRLTKLGAVMNANVRLEENASDSTLLDAKVTLLPNKKNSFKAELEGTNSAGDLGAALSVSYQNRNIFKGSELFNIKLRGAFEAIKGLSGYQDQNYLEYSAETGLEFPDFMFPFLKSSFRRNVKATSEVAVAFDSQDRPEFHRRVLTGSWRYKWASPGSPFQHRVDLLDLNYVFMPWISKTFADMYLNDPENRNAILRYNYENLFIMKWGYSFTYSSRSLSGANSNYGTDAYILRGSVESSGNLLYGISQAAGTGKNTLGQYTLFGIAYAQYVKSDVDFSKSFRINKSNSLALHFALGIAYPYGNSAILPYEKRYFSGGANSVRGWSVRELGPGSFVGTDGRIDFINQTGDLKLDMNLEYRTHLVWKLDGAVFVDAGNIWTLRDYADQPGGQFRFSTFYKQIAAAYGLGLRLNFDYFILRLDGGMKAVHPAYTDAKRHFPIVHPNFKRDFTFHFAVGLPF